MGELLPHPDLGPPLHPHLTSTQRIEAWIDLMEFGDELFLAGLSLRSKGEQDPLAAGRESYARSLTVWDHLRYTKVADFLISVADRDVDTMLAAFQDAGLRPKRCPPIVTVGEQRFVQCFYQPDETDFEIQVDFLFAAQPFQQDALTRRVATSFPEWDTNAFVLLPTAARVCGAGAVERVGAHLGRSLSRHEHAWTGCLNG